MEARDVAVAQDLVDGGDLGPIDPGAENVFAELLRRPLGRGEPETIAHVEPEGAPHERVVLGVPTLLGEPERGDAIQLGHRSLRRSELNVSFEIRFAPSFRPRATGLPD